MHGLAVHLDLARWSLFSSLVHYCSPVTAYHTLCLHLLLLCHFSPLVCLVFFLGVSVFSLPFSLSLCRVKPQVLLCVSMFVCESMCVGDRVWVFVHVSVGAWVCGCVGVCFLRVSVWIILEVCE